jgi:hypothetical protein
LPVLLNARCAQTGEAVLVDRGLARKEFVGCKPITAAGFVKGQQSATHGCNHLGFTSDNPAFRARQRQIGNRQWTAVRIDYVSQFWSKRDRHEYSHAEQLGNRVQRYARPDKLNLRSSNNFQL